jgi:hypothetical protein
MSEAQDKTVTFDRMPGADQLEEGANDRLDMNFGLGQEPEPAPEPEVEAEEEVETAQAEPEEAPEESEVSEVEAEEEAEEPSALGEEPEIEAEEPEIEEEPEQKKPMVPKSRLDEVLAKQKALQQQLDDLMAAKEQVENAPETYDFAEKEIEYQNLVLDGESQKAAALRAEIRQAERAQLEYELSQKMEQKVTQNQQMTALQQAAADLEANFPVFDRSSSDYSEEYTQEVIDLRDAFIVKGENAVAALSKAAKYVIKEYGLDSSSEAPSLATQAAPKQADEVAKKRAEVSRKLKAAASQPPELPGESSASRGERATDISNMTEEEFSALPEATLKRLRGDIL